MNNFNWGSRHLDVLWRLSFKDISIKNCCLSDSCVIWYHQIGDYLCFPWRHLLFEGKH